MSAGMRDFVRVAVAEPVLLTPFFRLEAEATEITAAAAVAVQTTGAMAATVDLEPGEGEPSLLVPSAWHLAFRLKVAMEGLEAEAAMDSQIYSMEDQVHQVRSEVPPRKSRAEQAAL